jgi:hypothetical protein
LIEELKFSEEAAVKRSREIRDHVFILRNPVFDAARCRYRKWYELGYRCISYKGWVFAYEHILDGVAIHDMLHSKLIADVVY